MDNRVFNINGKGKEMLVDVLRLALWHYRGGYEGQRDASTAKGYMIDPKKGLILLWVLDEHNSAHQKFLAPLGAEALAENVYAWLQTEEAKAIPLEGWDKDADHDGHNSRGWRVFCEDWGHVGTAGYRAIVGITPAYMWHGK